jgi:serine protease Do
VITGIGDDSVTNANTLRDRIGRIEPGQRVAVQVTRAGDTRPIEIPLTTIPNVLPAKVPPASIPAPTPVENNAAKSGRFTGTLPGEQQEYWAYVPENYNPDFAYGLLVWLHPSGDTMEAALLRAWQDTCQERGIILVGPKAADISGWTPDEAEFVRGVIEQIRSQYSIDTARVALHGAGVGGSFAWHLAFKYRELIRGVAVVGAPLNQPPPDNDPDFPLQVLAASAKEDRAEPRIEASIKLLQDMKYTSVLLTEPGAESDPAQFAAPIALWLDALDRI